MLCIAGCHDQGEGSVVVVVSAAPPLANVYKLQIAASIGMTTRDVEQVINAPTLPPAHAVTIVAPRRLGSMLDVDVTARDPAGVALASGHGSAPIVAGQVTTLPITLGAGADMGVAGPCTTVDEPFTSDPSPRWHLTGSTAWDARRGALELNPLTMNTIGGAFYDQPLYTEGFEATFNLRIADGPSNDAGLGGGDGFAFVLVQAPSVGAIDQSKSGGGGIGFVGLNGFAIEFDTYQNMGDPFPEYIGLTRASDGTHLAAAATPTLRSAIGHVAHVRFTGGHVTLWLDHEPLVDSDVMSGFVPGNYFFGFTSASGGAIDRHTVSGLVLTVGKPADCLPVGDYEN
jgi:hypothetical protein